MLNLAAFFVKSGKSNKRPYLHNENLTKGQWKKTSKTSSLYKKMFTMILKVITSDLFASKVGFLHV